MESQLTIEKKSSLFASPKLTVVHFVGGPNRPLHNIRDGIQKAILEQFAILSNVLAEDTRIEVYFATAYNRFGEGKTWQQERVKQFFAPEELLIGRDFWNFICQSDEGYDTILQAYKENAYLIRDALESIKKVYLGKNE